MARPLRPLGGSPVSPGMARGARPRLSSSPPLAQPYEKSNSKLIIFDFDGVLAPVDAVTREIDSNIPQAAAKIRSIQCNGTSVVDSIAAKLDTMGYDFIICSQNSQDRLDEIVPLLYGNRFKLIMGLRRRTTKSLALDFITDLGYDSIYFLDDTPSEIENFTLPATKILVPSWQSLAFEFLDEPLNVNQCQTLSILNNINE